MYEDIGKQLIRQGARGINNSPEQSLRILKRGIILIPDESVAWYNYGLALHCTGRIKSAIRAYKQAINSKNVQLDPIVNNLAQDLLLDKNFKEGWELYEHRLKRVDLDFRLYIELFGEAWKGEGDKREFDTLIVVSEQGYGDTFQFCRFITLLEERGLNVQFFCQEEVKNFLREWSSIKNIKNTIHKDGDKYLWCPLMSLPSRLGINNKNVPYKQGYFSVENTRYEKWRKILHKKAGTKLVALHWQGNKSFEKRLYSKNRSIEFRYLNMLSDIDGYEFIAIQKGEARNQMAKECDLSICKGQSEFDTTMDFRDTAAVLANCDLLISADSSVVHLAGGMGIPVWVMLSYVPEWRWGTEGEKSYWYQSVRLFRQNSANDWKETINRIRKEMQKGI